jgi:hypothetical protein
MDLANPGTNIYGTNVMSIVVEVPSKCWVHHTVGVWAETREKTIINF